MCDMREVGAEQERMRLTMEFMQNLLEFNVPFSKALELAKIDEKTYNEYKNFYNPNGTL